MSDHEEPPEDRLKLVYQQVCTSFEAITDFRGKLLALLPLATGTAGVLLVEHAPSPPLAPLGIFSAIATLGLYMYEFRGMQRCHRLEDQAKTLERKLGLSPEEGLFLGQPPRLFDNMLGPPAAGLVIYLAVVFAWIYIANLGFASPDKPPPWLPWLLAVGYGVVLWAALWFVHRHLPNWTASPTEDLVRRANEDLVRRGYKAFAKRRIWLLRRGLAPDVVWHLESRNRPTRNYQGATDVRGFLTTTTKLANGNFQAEFRGVVADKEYVISLHVVHWDQKFEDCHVLVLQVYDGRIKEVWHYIPDQNAYDRFFSETAVDRVSRSFNTPA